MQNIQESLFNMTAQSKPIIIEVGPGEMIDKITILMIKSERMTAPDKLKNVRHELAVLQQAKIDNIAPSEDLDTLEEQLKSVNEALWEIEDDIRQCEVDKEFGEKFVALARSVYIQNDKRAELKKQINLLVGTSIIEEKSYTQFN